MSNYQTDRETLERTTQITFMRSTGPGGQHKNKRETGVRLVHFPSGVTVTATERRSQWQNREAAFERLAQRLEALNRKPKKRVATKPSKAMIQKRLEQKRIQSRKKSLRKNPNAKDF